MLNTLVTRILRIFYESYFNEDKTYLLGVLVINCYKRCNVIKAFHKARQGPRPQRDIVDHILKVQLPYVQGIIDRIACILRKNQVYACFKPLNTIQGMLRSVKDPIYPSIMKDIYLIVCSCGAPYVGDIDWFVKQRIQEHILTLNIVGSIPLLLLSMLKKQSTIFSLNTFGS